VGSGSFLIVLAMMVAMFAAVVCVWAVRRSRAIVFDRDRYPGLVTLRRATLTARYAGLAAGIVVFVVAAALGGPLGRGLFLAPGMAGSVVVLAIMTGQQVAYGGARTKGLAAVEIRLVRRYVPRGLTVAVLLCLAVLVATAAWTTVSAGRDDLGLARAYTVSGTSSLQAQMDSEIVLVSSTRTPFPGAFYTLMTAIGVPAAVLLCGIALWLTARRPRNGSDPDLVAVDDALRRQTAEGVVAAAGLAVSLSLLGVTLGSAFTVAAMAEFGVRYLLAGAVLGAVALGSLVVAAWCTVLVLVPSGGAVKPS
jgi:hypothetical protein